ncbi:MAG TPA: GlsB/YeaQ/YmgE family stress response membrane protein [Candidatus Saccharimonadales bacterium]|jgi:uncharacterized membrane protein YeaQ/YmgE (transglycosylase-associated protein family)
MSIIISLIIGGVIGWLAAKVAGRNEGIIASMAIGIVGSIIGGFLSVVLGAGGHAYLSFSWASVAWSFIGALILVLILNALQHNSHHSTGI